MEMPAQLAACQPDVPGSVPVIHTMKSTKGGAIMRHATARASPSRAGTQEIVHNGIIAGNAGRHGTKTIDGFGDGIGQGTGDIIALGAPSGGIKV
jgi:hypothetical protein